MYAATISAIIRLMVYGIVCIALIRLRQKDNFKANFFKLPFGNVIAIVGIGITGWLLASAKMNELRDVSIAIAVGFVIYFSVQFFGKKK